MHELQKKMADLRRFLPRLTTEWTGSPRIEFSPHEDGPWVHFAQVEKLVEEFANAVEERTVPPKAPIKVWPVEDHNGNLVELFLYEEDALQAAAEDSDVLCLGAGVEIKTEYVKKSLQAEKIKQEMLDKGFTEEQIAILVENQK